MDSCCKSIKVRANARSAERLTQLQPMSFGKHRSLNEPQSQKAFQSFWQRMPLLSATDSWLMLCLSFGFLNIMLREAKEAISGRNDQPILRCNQEGKVRLYPLKVPPLPFERGQWGQRTFQLALCESVAREWSGAPTTTGCCATTKNISVLLC